MVRIRPHRVVVMRMSYSMREDTMPVNTQQRKSVGIFQCNALKIEQNLFYFNHTFAEVWTPSFSSSN
jgi:hypothetical protein